jgi:arylsulfatase A
LIVKQPRTKKGKQKRDDKQENAKTSKPQILLFNLADDLSETTNHADKHPENVQALQARMIELDHEITTNARTVWRKN